MGSPHELGFERSGLAFVELATSGEELEQEVELLFAALVVEILRPPRVV
jgi:hypothetical protein